MWPGYGRGRRRAGGRQSGLSDGLTVSDPALSIVLPDHTSQSTVHSGPLPVLDTTPDYIFKPHFVLLSVPISLFSCAATL